MNIIYTPQDFGAVSFGDIDVNAKAFQEAIDVCQNEKVALYIPDGVYIFNKTLVIKNHITIDSAPTAQLRWQKVSPEYSAGICIDFSNLSGNTGWFKFPCLYWEGESTVNWAFDDTLTHPLRIGVDKQYKTSKPSGALNALGQWDISGRAFTGLKIIEADVIEVFVHYMMYWNNGIHILSKESKSNRGSQNIHLSFTVLDNNNYGILLESSINNNISECKIEGVTIGVCKAGIKSIGNVINNHINIRSIWPYNINNAFVPMGFKSNNIINPFPLVQKEFQRPLGNP